VNVADRDLQHAQVIRARHSPRGCAPGRAATNYRLTGAKRRTAAGRPGRSTRYGCRRLQIAAPATLQSTYTIPINTPLPTVVATSQPKSAVNRPCISGRDFPERAARKPPRTGPPMWRSANIQKYSVVLSASRACVAPNRDVITQRDTAMGTTYPKKAPMQSEEKRMSLSMTAMLQNAGSRNTRRWPVSPPRSGTFALSGTWLPQAENRTTRCHQKQAALRKDWASGQANA
jgi:hypothetical protein